MTTNIPRLGDEGFLLAPYSPLLRLAKKHSKTVKLKGGFVPKRFALWTTFFKTVEKLRKYAIDN